MTRELIELFPKKIKRKYGIKRLSKAIDEIFTIEEIEEFLELEDPKVIKEVIKVIEIYLLPTETEQFIAQISNTKGVRLIDHYDLREIVAVVRHLGYDTATVENLQQFPLYVRLIDNRLQEVILPQPFYEPVGHYGGAIEYDNNIRYTYRDMEFFPVEEYLEDTTWSEWWFIQQSIVDYYKLAKYTDKQITIYNLLGDEYIPL